MTSKLENLWSDDKAKAMSDSELLQYRSNLLGSDLRITNYGGGNTSAKLSVNDSLSGEPTRVLWVKGSGGDLSFHRLIGFCHPVHGQTATAKVTVPGAGARR